MTVIKSLNLQDLQLTFLACFGIKGIANNIGYTIQDKKSKNVMAFTSHKIDGEKNVSQIRPDRQNSRRRKIKKQIKDTLQVSCHDNLSEYLAHSTLHGLRYVGDRLISRFERIFFAITFVLVMGLSIFFISVVWEKWNNSPLIIALSSNEYSVKELPFPG